MQTRINDRNAMFGKRVRLLRQERGLTQVELGKLLGVRSYHSGAIISGWERAKREPSYNQLCKLADVFGVSVDFLLGQAPSQDYNKT
jgi:transcriptional regulator with XRE-family HTH domain